MLHLHLSSSRLTCWLPAPRICTLLWRIALDNDFYSIQRCSGSYCFHVWTQPVSSDWLRFRCHSSALLPLCRMTSKFLHFRISGGSRPEFWQHIFAISLPSCVALNLLYISPKILTHIGIVSLGFVSGDPSLRPCFFFEGFIICPFTCQELASHPCSYPVPVSKRIPFSHACILELSEDSHSHQAWVFCFVWGHLQQHWTDGPSTTPTAMAPRTS